MVSRARQIRAAGAVVVRDVGGGPEVLLVHRPSYDDWSFPKGKLDRGEHAAAAAVREVEEETGVRIRLTLPLTSQRYPVKAGEKIVDYWCGEVLDPDAPGAEAYQPNAEIDEAAWIPLDKAALLLTYDFDRDTLVEAVRTHRRTRTIVVVRHAEARLRRLWHRDDRLRPLLVVGQRRAARLVELLNAFGVERVITSTSTRCLETVAPYAEHLGVPVEATALLSEEDFTGQAVGDLARSAFKQAKRLGPTALCSHGPVLPAIFAAYGVADQKLAKGEIAVLHLRKGSVRAIERHLH